MAELVEALAVEAAMDQAIDFIEELPENVDLDYVNSEIISICGSFVELRPQEEYIPVAQKTLHLVHASVREFLLDTVKFSETAAHPTLKLAAAQHSILSRVCLSFLNIGSTWDSLRVQQPGFLDYAAHQWWRHANWILVPEL